MKGILRISIVLGKEMTLENAERELSYARDLSERIVQEGSAFGYEVRLETVDFSARKPK